MGYLRSSAVVMLAVYIGIAVLGISFLPHSVMGETGNCIDASLGQGHCPPSAAAATAHHLTALHSFSEVLAASFIMWALVILAALLYIALAVPFPPPLDRAATLRAFIAASRSPNAAFIRYLSRFVRSPSL